MMAFTVIDNNSVYFGEHGRNAVFFFLSIILQNPTILKLVHKEAKL